MTQPDLEVIHRPEDPDLPYRLGAHTIHDPASRNYRARALVAAEQPILSVDHRRLVPLYQQNGYGSCISQSGHGSLSTEPWRHRYHSQRRILRAYGEMTALDPFPGTFNWRQPDAAGSEDTGTSVLTLGQYLKAKGLISEYRWNFSFTDTLHAIQLRPLVVAGAWRPSMFANPSHGTEPLRIDWSEQPVGGHALSATRLDVDRKLLGGPNSWGEDWGWWWMSWAVAERWLAEDGDSMLVLP